ncbi:MAG: response regulator [Candidatus Omnitrophica bacterium]|nr:response regulator [Candidatus Omnitrophota bacterium]MBU4477671.1 response regulator [Candidatus Omnitrophota bacterium]MCG2704336.1 response regulator [Candidatus Omnitrophota bacterium]
MAAEKRKILVVDNDEDFLRIVKLNLEETGRYEVRTESCGTYCMADILVFQPDLIFLDVVMDDVGGPENASNVCRHYFTKNKAF